MNLKSIFKSRFNKLKDLFITRKISLIFFLCIFIFAQIVGYLIIAAFSGLSQIFETIRIPDGLIDLNLDIYSPEDMEVNIPYYIKNQGIYDLNDLYMEVYISVNYIDMITRENITLQIFAKANILPDCEAFSSLIGNFTGTFHDFNVTAIVDFMENADYFEPLYFFTDISFQAKYFWDLIDVSIFLDDVGLLGN